MNTHFYLDFTPIDMASGMVETHIRGKVQDIINAFFIAATAKTPEAAGIREIILGTAKAIEAEGMRMAWEL
jgi:hypothetical protein